MPSLNTGREEGGTLFQNNRFWGIVPNTSQFQKFVKKMCILGVRPNTRKEFVENAYDCWQLANFLHISGHSELIKKGLHVCVMQDCARV